MNTVRSFSPKKAFKGSSGKKGKKSKKSAASKKILTSFHKNQAKNMQADDAPQLIVTNQSEVNGIIIPTRMVYISPNRNNNISHETRRSVSRGRSPEPYATSRSHLRGDRSSS